MFRNVANRIRSWLRRWLAVPSETPGQAIVEDAKRKGISIAAAVLHKAGERQVVHRKVEAPKLMPGVVPKQPPTDDPGQLGAYLALDSEFNAPAYAYANQFHCGLGFPGYAYLAELSQRSEYRAPSETIAQEMTREFIELTVHGKPRKRKPQKNDSALLRDIDDHGYDAAPSEGEGKPAKPTTKPNDKDGNGIDDALDDKLEQLEAALEEFKVRELLRKCAELDGQFGRAQLYINIDTNGRDETEVQQLPLLIEPETIKKGSLKCFKVIEPIWTTPYTYNATNAMADDFYKPRAWYVLGRRVHASRLLTFIMREVPDMLKPAYNFGGLSMTQLMEPYVFQWLRTRNSVSDLIHNFSVMVLKTNMQNVLSGEPDVPGGLFDRMKLFVSSRDNQGLTVIDKDTEEMQEVHASLAGLHELQAQSQENMAAPSHIPLVKLIGVSPQGLNASSEGEITVFYDFVRACQQQFFGPHLKTILQILQLHLFGEIDDAIGFMFRPLTAPTVKELAEIRKSNAETDAAYIDKGVISPDEVRERVGSDPDSGYDNLSGAAPPPPTQIDAEHGAELNEEAAQANHERQLEADKAAAKLKPKSQAA